MSLPPDTSGTTLIVTGGDSVYFPMIEELHQSIQAAFPENPPPFGVIDAGLTPDQISKLRGVGAIVAQIPDDPTLPKAALRRRPALAANFGKLWLDKIFPGHALLIWLDADTWVQEADAVRLIERAARTGALEMCIRDSYYCIASVEAATTMPFDQGMLRESELFLELVGADEAKALRYAFFAEREAAKLPDMPASAKARDLNNAAVVGAGTMGGGIAMSFADFGYDVKIMDATKEALDRGMERIRSNYATSVKRGSLKEDEMNRRLARIHPVDGYDDIKDCDVVIEAVFEEMDVKKPIFAKLDEVMKPGALMFSNTSALDIDQIAAMTKRPQDVAGTHFFSPANVMKLFEVVRGAKSAPETLVTAMALGKQIGKISAMAGNTDGFVANRSRAPFNAEMVILLEEGCLPEQVDKVMVDFGYPMGPFAVGDLAGLDIGAAGRRRRAAADPNYRKLPIADKLVELGRYGQKTGAGWYKYEKGDRTPHPDPDVAAIIKTVAAELGVPRKTFTDTEILHRLLFASVNEACRILEEGKAYRASDIDVMWLHGFGFPRYRGGLMYWADGIGVKNVYNQIASWHQQYGSRWAPSRLLRELAESGTPFREAKPAPFQ